MAYSIGNISEIIGGRFSGPRTADCIEHLLLDSRRLVFPATSLFFALKGRGGMGTDLFRSYIKEG